MYRKAKFEETSIIVTDNLYEGETIEMKVERIMTNGEAITDGAELIYQERDEGVKPSFDIRSDRFDYAIEAMDKVAGSKLAERKERLDELNKKKNPKKEEKDDKIDDKNTGGESTQGTSAGSSQEAGK